MEEGRPGVRGLRSGVRAVYFDVGGTLLRVRPSVGEVYRRIGARFGMFRRAVDLESRFRRAWGLSVERGRDRGHRCSAEILREEWRTIVWESFLPAPAESVRFDELFDALYDHFATPSPWQLADGVLETLEWLRARGVALGVLSNWDGRLRETLGALDLLHRFDHVIVSHEVGFEKPSRRIFEAALAATALAPPEVLHVGDSLECDVEPAREIGMRAVWLRPGSGTVRVGGSSCLVAEGLGRDGGVDWDSLVEGRA